MLIIYANNVDISTSVVKDSVKITEKLNNRSAAATFTSLGTKVSQGHEILIYEATELTAQASSGQKNIVVLDTYEYQTKFVAGDHILLDIGGNEYRAEIDSVTHATKTITLVDNLPATLAVRTKIGRKIYAGDCLRNPDRQIDYSGTISYLVDSAGYTKRFDAELIAESYLDMYPREVIGRAMYEFVPNTTEETLTDFGSAWTESGTARVMADETTDVAQGAKSQKTGSTGAGGAIWTKAITSTNLSAYDHVRLWYKIKTGYGNNISAVKVRVGNDATHYYEWSSYFFGADNEECWHYESFELSYPDVTVGTVDLTAIDWLQIEMTATGSIPAGNILFDVMQATSGGFTIKNVIRGDNQFTILNVQYKKPTVLIDEIAKSQLLNWYIDYDRDLHLFKNDATLAPWTITNATTNYNNLTFETDITQVKNRQTVRGSEVAATATRTDIYVADGQQTAYPLPYKMKDLEVWVDAGAGYIQKTVGVENLVDEATVDFVSNFQEKTVRNANLAKLNAGDKIKFIYYPYQPVRVRARDATSILYMKNLVGGRGIYDGSLITDSSIQSYEEARARAEAEIDQYKNPLVKVKFQTEKDGLSVGQLISITDTHRTVDDQYLIQSVRRTSISDDCWRYDIDCGSTLFGIIEFFQLLYKRSGDVTIDENEAVDIVLNIDEVITLTPALTFTAASDEYYSCAKDLYRFDWISYSAETTKTTSGGTSDKRWYTEFAGGETGSVDWDTTTNNDNGCAVKFTATSGGAGKSIMLRSFERLSVEADKLHTVWGWIEIPTLLTNISSGGAKLVIKEYNQKYDGTLLATNTIFSGKTAARDFDVYTGSFTTNVATTHIQIELSIYQAAGVVSFADLWIIPTVTETTLLPAISDFSQT